MPTEPETVQLDGVEAERFVTDLVRRAVSPHAGEIARLGPGNILVVVHDAAPRARTALKAMGAQDAPVFVLGEPQRGVLARTDHITERWVQQPPAEGCLKIFLITGPSTLLVNYTEGSGWSVEDDSTSNSALN